MDDFVSQISRSDEFSVFNLVHIYMYTPLMRTINVVLLQSYFITSWWHLCNQREPSTLTYHRYQQVKHEEFLKLFVHSAKRGKRQA